MSTETKSVQINGATTDLIKEEVITNTETGEVVSSRTVRQTMPTSEAWSIIESSASHAWTPPQLSSSSLETQAT